MPSSNGSAWAVSSLEALSTTITSCETSLVLLATAIKHLNVYSHLLKTGMMTETTGAGWMWDIVGRISARRVPTQAHCAPPVRGGGGREPASEFRYASEL